MRIEIHTHVARDRKRDRPSGGGETRGAARLLCQRGPNRAAGALRVDRPIDVDGFDASAVRMRHEVARNTPDIDVAAGRTRRQRSVDLTGLDVATGRLELGLAGGRSELDVAAGGACVDVSLNVAELEAPARGLADYLAVQIGDVDIAA